MPNSGDTKCQLGKLKVWVAPSGGDGYWEDTGKNCNVNKEDNAAKGSKASERAIQRAIKQDNKDWKKGKGKYSGAPS